MTIQILNIIAGIAIGIASDTWPVRLIAPFLWGAVFCVYISMFGQKMRDAFMTTQEGEGRKARWGMSHKQAFYFMLYVTAAFTTLVFAVISGAIKDLF